MDRDSADHTHTASSRRQLTGWAGVPARARRLAAMRSASDRTGSAQHEVQLQRPQAHAVQATRGVLALQRKALCGSTFQCWRERCRCGDLERQAGGRGGRLTGGALSRGCFCSELCPASAMEGLRQCVRGRRTLVQARHARQPKWPQEAARGKEREGGAQRDSTAALAVSASALVWSQHGTPNWRAVVGQSMGCGACRQTHGR